MLLVKGSQIVVLYDLDGPFPAKVHLKAETTGNELIAQHVKGDVGMEVTPGMDRKIIWNVPNDVVRNLNGEELLLDVIAAAQ